MCLWPFPSLHTHTQPCFHLLHTECHWPVLTISSALFLFALPLCSRSVKQWVICQLVPLKTLPSLLSGMQLTGTHNKRHTHTHKHSHNPRLLIRFMSCNPAAS